MSRVVVILNPTAAGGRAARAWAELEPLLPVHLPDAQVLRTTAHGAAARLCQEALEAGAELVVSVGGDGTHSQVASGFFDASGTNRAPTARLALLPVGTGGDLARTLDPGRSPAAVLASLDRPGRAVDIGHLRFTRPDGGEAARTFINIASAGLSGLVDRWSNRVPRRLGGRLTFFLASLLATAGYRPRPVELEIDGELVAHDRLLLFAVCNGRYFGGGMQVAPTAEIDDGRLELVTIEGGMLASLRLSRHIYRGRHLALPFVRHRQVRRVVARPLDARPVLLDIDGEQPGQLPAELTILPGALRLVAGPPPEESACAGT